MAISWETCEHRCVVNFAIVVVPTADRTDWTLNSRFVSVSKSGKLLRRSNKTLCAGSTDRNRHINHFFYGLTQLDLFFLHRRSCTRTVFFSRLFHWKQFPSDNSFRLFLQMTINRRFIRSYLFLPSIRSFRLHYLRAAFVRLKILHFLYVFRNRRKNSKTERN